MTKSQGEKRRNNSTRAEKHEGRAVCAEAIFQRADEGWTQEGTHIGDCHHQRNPSGRRRSSEEPCRYRPKRTIRGTVPNRNERQGQDGQSGLGKESTSEKPRIRDQQRNSHMQRALVSAIGMDTVQRH